MMDASQARASYAAEAAVTAWRGKAGMLWPIFSGLVLTVLRLGILFWCVGAAMYITAGSAQLWGALLGFAVAAGAVFHAACELLWWRAFTDDAGCLSPRSSLRDLPAMLSIDLIFGCARYFSMTAAACCALSGQVMAAATGALIALVAAILQPAVTAQKLISDRPLAICAREAALTCMRRPTAALAAHFVPGMLSASFGMAALTCALAQYTAPGITLALLAALPPLVQPALWVALFKRAAYRR